MTLVASMALVAATSFTIMAATLPLIVGIAKQGAVAFMTMSTGLLAFAPAALAAGAAALVLGAGMVVAAAGITLVSVAIMALSAGMMLIALSAQIFAASIALMAASLPLIVAMAGQGAIAFTVLGLSLIHISLSVKQN